MDEPQKPPALCETCGKPLAGPVERLLAETLTGGIAFPAEPLQPEEVRPGYLRCQFRMWGARMVFEAVKSEHYTEEGGFPAMMPTPMDNNVEFSRATAYLRFPELCTLPNRAGLWLVTITPAEEQ